MEVDVKNTIQSKKYVANEFVEFFSADRVASSETHEIVIVGLA